FVRRIYAAVPNDDLAGPVLLCRNDTFERRIGKRMVLSRDCHAFVPRIERWSFRHGPGFQHAVEFQPEIVVQPPRSMLLHHKQQRPATIARQLRLRLRCPRELTLVAVSVERWRHRSATGRRRWAV